MKILVLAAHADDETLGCGGWIPILLQKKHEVAVVLLSDAEIALRGSGISNKASFAKALKILGVTEHYSLGLPDQKFDTISIGDIANKVLSLNVSPDLVISHSSFDLNQDHRITSEVAKIIARPKAKPVSLLAMEIPAAANWNGAAFAPNFYVDISQSLATKKEAFGVYQNELHEFPHPYSIQGIDVVARFRGMEAGFMAAEGFQAFRLCDAHANI